MGNWDVFVLFGWIRHWHCSGMIINHVRHLAKHPNNIKQQQTKPKIFTCMFSLYLSTKLNFNSRHNTYHNLYKLLSAIQLRHNCFHLIKPLCRLHFETIRIFHRLLYGKDHQSQSTLLILYLNLK